MYIYMYMYEMCAIIHRSGVKQSLPRRLVSLCAALGAQTGREEHRKQAGTVYLNAEDLAQ